MCFNKKQLTSTFGSNIDFTQVEDSRVHGLTVSVLPSLYNLVIDASYVRLNLPASYKHKVQSIVSFLKIIWYYYVIKKSL